MPTYPTFAAAATSAIKPVPDPPTSGATGRQAHPADLQQRRRRSGRPLREEHGGRGGGSACCLNQGRGRGAAEIKKEAPQRSRAEQGCAYGSPELVVVVVSEGKAAPFFFVGNGGEV